MHIGTLSLGRFFVKSPVGKEKGRSEGEKEHSSERGHVMVRVKAAGTN